MKNKSTHAEKRPRKYRKVTVACCPLLLLGGLSLAGVVESYGQSTLNTGGGSGEISGNTYSFSLGEMTRIQTVVNPGLVVTEGVLQPSGEEEGNSIADTKLRLDALKVFPNPVSDFLIVQPNLKTGGTLLCRLTDIQGRLLHQQEFTLVNGNEKQRLDMTGLAAGNYLLNATVIVPGNKRFYNSFKIQKLQ